MFGKIYYVVLERKGLAQIKKKKRQPSKILQHKKMVNKIIESINIIKLMCLIRKIINKLKEIYKVMWHYWKYQTHRI